MKDDQGKYNARIQRLAIDSRDYPQTWEGPDRDRDPWEPQPWEGRAHVPGA